MIANPARTLFTVLIAVLVAAPIWASASGPSAPKKPTANDLTATSVTLFWETPKDRGAGLEGYRIYRNDQIIVTLSAVSASYRDSGLQPSTSYTYKIEAFDKAKQTSPVSASVTVKTRAEAKVKASKDSSSKLTVKTPSANASTTIAAPEQLKVRNVTAFSATFTWVPPKGGPPPARYRLYRGVILIAVISSEQTSFIDDALQPETSYTYTIRAFDKGESASPQSAPITFTTLKKP